MLRVPTVTEAAALGYSVERHLAHDPDSWKSGFCVRLSGGEHLTDARAEVYTGSQRAALAEVAALAGLPAVQVPDRARRSDRGVARGPWQTKRLGLL